VGVRLIVAVGVIVGVGVMVGVGVIVGVFVIVGVLLGVRVIVGVRVCVAVGVTVRVFVGVRVRVAVLVGVGSEYVYCAHTVTPAFVEAWLTTFPAPLVLKLAVAVTGIVALPGPLKSLIGRYGERVAVVLVVTPKSMLPEVPAKSRVPSYAVKLCVTTLVGDAMRLGAVGGVTVIVPLPVPVTVAGAESKLSSLISCTIVAVAVRSTAVSTPSAGSNLASVTLEVQLVVVCAMVSQTVCVTLCAAATAGRRTTTIAVRASAPTARRSRRQLRQS
jgi:hypothetical protein